MKNVTAAVLLIAGLITAGSFVACHSFSTVQGNINSNRIAGLIYYLPKGRIRITGNFKDGGGDDSKTGKSKKKTLVRSDAPDDSGTPEPKNFVVTIAAEIEADPTARYLLTPDRNYFYNDEINIGVNGKQLLSTGEATAEDQTAQIISTIAQTAAQVLEKGGAVPPPITPPERVSKLLLTVQTAIKERTASLDTTLPSAALFGLQEALHGFSRERESEGKRYVDELSQRNFVSIRSVLRLLHMFPSENEIDWLKAPYFWEQLRTVLTVKPAPPKPLLKPRPFNIVIDPGPQISRDVTDMEGNIFLKISITEELHQPDLQLLKTIWEAQPRDRKLAHGIIFRPLRAYDVTVKSIGTYFEIDEHRQILLPDCRREHELLLDYSRLAFVKKTTKIAFVDGTPQKLGQTVPSPVLGFLAIPKGIVQAMVPLASSITGTPVGVQAPGTTGTANSPAPAPEPATSP